MIITPANLNGLFTTFDTRFSAAYAAMRQTKPWSPALAMEMPSRSTTNVYAWLAKLPRMREWLGPRMVVNLSTNQYILKNKKFELTVSVEREKLEDDQYDTYGQWMDMAAYEAVKWPDQQVAPLLLNGETGASGVAFDGQNFFDPSHPLGDGSASVQSNYFTGKALTPYNYGLVRTAMMTLNGEDSQNLGVNPDTLIVPPQLQAMAQTIVGSPLIGYGGTLDAAGTSFAGITNPYAGTAKVMVIPELSSQPTAWYLADTSKPILPLIWQLRQAPEFTYRNQLTDEHVFNVDEFLYGIRARGAAGYGLWFMMAKAVA